MVKQSINDIGTSRDINQGNVDMIIYGLFSLCNPSFCLAQNYINSLNMNQTEKQIKVKELYPNIMNLYNELMKLYKCMIHEQIDYFVKEMKIVDQQLLGHSRFLVVIIFMN